MRKEGELQGEVARNPALGLGNRRRVAERALYPFGEAVDLAARSTSDVQRILHLAEVVKDDSEQRFERGRSLGAGSRRAPNRFGECDSKTDLRSGVPRPGSGARRLTAISAALSAARRPAAGRASGKARSRLRERWESCRDPPPRSWGAAPSRIRRQAPRPEERTAVRAPCVRRPGFRRRPPAPSPPPRRRQSRVRSPQTLRPPERLRRASGRVPSLDRLASHRARNRRRRDPVPDRAAGRTAPSRGPRVRRSRGRRGRAEAAERELRLRHRDNPSRPRPQDSVRPRRG